MPAGFVEHTPGPKRPEFGTKNRDLDIYAKRLEASLAYCNLDKQKLREWDSSKDN